MIVKNSFMRETLTAAKNELAALQQELSILVENGGTPVAVSLLNEKVLVVQGEIKALREVIRESKAYKEIRQAKKEEARAIELAAATQVRLEKEEAAGLTEKEEEEGEDEVPTPTPIPSKPASVSVSTKKKVLKKKAPKK